MAKKISSLSVVLGATVKPFVSAFSGAKGAVTSLTSSLGSAGSAVLKFTGVGAILGGAFAALKGAASGISLAAELEQTSVAFETMLGSATAAKSLMEGLQTLAASTPFEFPEIAGAAKRLLAFGVGADQMSTKLTMLGDIAAGTGKPLNELAAIYGKIKSRGQLTGETLNQLAESGLPIYRSLAKELGVAESQVAALVSAGKVGFPQVDKALAGLTGTGGQFSGMMAKQSQTLAGLWSTLTDNIGMGLAGLVTTIVDAFGLKDGLKALVAGTGSIGAWLNAAVKSYAPIFISFARGAWDAISGAFSRIYAFVVPIVSAIGDFIARNWQSALSTTTALWTAMYGVIKSVAGVVWSAVQGLWSGVVAVWTWAADLLGIKTAQTGSTVGNIFQTLVEWGQWLQRGITLALNVAGYAITHWRDLVEMAGVGVLLSLARIGNQVQYVFTEVIPALLTWFADNWTQIFTDIANFNATVFTNMAKNVANFFAAVWGAMKGEGFNFEWTALAEGFEATLQELPKIAERQMGPIEAGLQREADRLGASFSKGLGEYLAEQDAVAKGLADGITGAAGALADSLMPKIELPTVGATPFAPMTTALDDVTAKAKEANNALGAVLSGSAQGQLLKFQAGMKFAAPKPAPIGAAARKDMDAGKQTALTKQLVDLTRQGNQTLAEVVEAASGAESFVEVAI